MMEWKHYYCRVIENWIGRLAMVGVISLVLNACIKSLF